MAESESINFPVILFVGVISMLLLSISIIFFYIIYQKRLFGQKKKMDYMEVNHQRELLNANLRAQEAERKRVAQDIHDSIGSLLSAMKLYISQLNAEKADFAYLKAETLELLETTIQNVRIVTNNLLPVSLERFGVISAVEDLCRRIEDLDVLEIQLKYNQNLRFDPQQEVALYRILQEMLNNTLKHAEATKVHIHFQFRQEVLQVMYKDNGKGFNPEEGMHDFTRLQGHGLTSIKSRLNFLNARHTAESQAQQGYHISIEFPVHIS